MPTPPSDANFARELFIAVAGSILALIGTWFPGYVNKKRRERANAEDLLCVATSELREQNLIHTDDVSAAGKQRLIDFVGNNERRVSEIESSWLKPFKQKQLASYYYLFAIQSALVRRVVDANRWVDKALSATQGWQPTSRLPCLRWAARIKRLIHDENNANRYLSEVIRLSIRPTLANKDPSSLAKFYRSRGACLFNLNNFTGAAEDFQKSIDTLAHPDCRLGDKKVPYAFCGWAMSLYMMMHYPSEQTLPQSQGLDEILRLYAHAVDLEPRLFAETPTVLRDNLRHLELYQSYYFSPFEKLTIDKLREELAKAQKQPRTPGNEMPVSGRGTVIPASA